VVSIKTSILMGLIDIIVAVLLDFSIGDPYWFPHPVIYIGKLISYLEEKGRKYFKSSKGLKILGGLIVLSIITVSFGIPFLILWIVRDSFWIYHILNIFILWTTLAAKSLKIEGKRVYYALKNENIQEARKKLSYIVGRDTRELTKEEIIRADIETIMENTADGIIAPLFYGMIGGAPLAMMYKGVNTMDSMLGYMNDKYIHLGFFPAKVDDVFNFIPARISGVLICLSAPVVDGSIIRSFKIMLRDRKNHKSPNCAYPEAAAAGAMGIQIGGTNVYFGKVVYKPTIGDKVKDLHYELINHSVKLMYASEILMVMIYALIVYSLR
jgi:adenosylcobinamide-phosphate synthase